MRIDPASGTVVATLKLAPSWVWGAYDIAFGFGSIWVRQLDGIVRVQP